MASPQDIEAPAVDEKKIAIVSDQDQSDTTSERNGETDLGEIYIFLSLPTTGYIAGRKTSDANDNDTVAVEGQYTKEEYHKLKRKVDKYLLPLMWICYGIQQTDKTALGTQAIFGLRQDTGLKGQEYSWLTTIFCTFHHTSRPSSPQTT